MAAPHERGAALGAYQSAASFGRVLGPFTASAVAGLSTLAWPFAVGAVVSLGGIVLVRAAGRSADRLVPAAGGTKPPDASRSSGP
jgi:MFS family permease